MLIATCTTFTACNDDAEDNPVLASNKLNISVGLQQPQGRAIITGTSLLNGSSIGILLDDGEATSYDAVNNVKFTATAQDSKQVWNPDADIVLDETKGTLYAYYPYAAGTNLTAIPISTASQTDYLYAEPVQNVSEKNASVAVTMKHMLANVNVTVNKGTYVGTGNISKISIQSEGFATAGTFNAAQATSAFTTTTGAGNAIEQTVTTTLGGTAADIMVVPTGTAKPITFMVRVDDVDYTVTSSDVTLESGNSYNYTLSLNSTFMTVSEVAVTPWNHVTKESLTLSRPGETNAFEDYIKLTYAVENPDDPVLLINPYEEVGLDDIPYLGVELSAIDDMMIQEQGMQEAITITPSYEYQFTTTGEHTVYVKLKDVTQIPLAAFAPIENLKIVYIPKTVTNIGILAFHALVESFEVDENNTVYDSRNNCNAIIHSETNELLYGCVNTVIPNDCQAIGDYAFCSCEELTGNLIIPNSVTKIGECAFDGCKGLTGELVIPNSVTSIGESAFYNCEGLTSLQLSSNLQSIEFGAFQNCGFTGELIIPNSVNNIEDYAFKGCKELTSIVIPNSVTSIGERAFKACYKLESIISLAITAPSLGMKVFEENYNIGTLYYPSGSDYSTWKSQLPDWSYIEQ